MMTRQLLFCVLTVEVLFPLRTFGQEDEWIVSQTTNVEASLRGIAVVSDTEAWVTGSGGVILHTVNGGTQWSRIRIPKSDALDFRDVAVLQHGVVLLMSAGPGDKSRVFLSTDAGQSWASVLTNNDDSGFFNAFTFSDALHGILVGDPIEGHLDVYCTGDSGRSWKRERGPALRQGEYGFAASGTNVMAMAPNHLWVATGGSVARVFRSSGDQRQWTSVVPPIVQGNESTGIFSIAFRDPMHGVIVGGDYKEPAAANGNVARTGDGGRTWTSADLEGKIPHKACVRHVAEKTWMTVGRTGVAVSRDDGATWRHVSEKSYYTFDVDAKTGSGWMAGSDGRVARFTLPSE